MIRIKNFFSFLFVQGRNSNIVNLSAQMSYRLLTAFIPLLMLIYSFINWVLQNLNMDFLENFNWIIPNSFLVYLNIARQQSADLSLSANSNLIISFVALYISVSAMYALIRSLNRIFEHRDQREGIILWVQAVVYLFLFLIITALILFVYIVGEYILNFLFDWFQLPQSLSFLLSLFTIIYLLGMMSTIFTLIYMFAPKHPLKLIASLPGGIFVSFFWLTIFIIYWFFLSANLDLTNFFFQLQGPFSLMIGVYLIAFTLNLGAVVNLYSFKYLEKRVRYNAGKNS